MTHQCSVILTKRHGIYSSFNHHHTRCTAIHDAIFDQWEDYVWLDNQWYLRKNAVRWMQPRGPEGGATMRSEAPYVANRPRGTPHQPGQPGQEDTGTATGREDTSTGQLDDWNRAIQDAAQEGTPQQPGS